MNLKNILNGWANFIEKSEVTEALAEKRAKICLDCPNNKYGKVLTFIKDDLKEIQSNYCSLCKCVLSAKVRSENEKCDLGLW